MRLLLKCGYLTSVLIRQRTKADRDRRKYYEIRRASTSTKRWHVSPVLGLRKTRQLRPMEMKGLEERRAETRGWHISHQIVSCAGGKALQKAR